MLGGELLVGDAESPTAVPETAGDTEVKEMRHVVDDRRHIVTLAVVLEAVLDERGVRQQEGVVGDAEDVALLLINDQRIIAEAQAREVAEVQHLAGVHVP